MSKAEAVQIDDGRDDLPFQIHWELDDAPLSVDAFRVYAHLVRCAGKNGLVFPSYQTIGEKCFRASVGAAANPKSLRNRAIRAMKELIDCGLVTKQSRVRTKSGNTENDSNIYQLTPRRIWLAELKQRSEALEAATQAARWSKSGGSEQGGGGIPSVPPPGIPAIPPGILSVPPPGIAGVPGGIPSVPKVSSNEVLQSFEVHSIEAPPQQTENPLTSPPVNGAAAFSPDGSNIAPAEQLGPEGGENPLKLSPDLSQEQGKAENQAPSFERVPAAGPAPKYAVLGLVPIPRSTLAARSARDPERMTQLRALLSASHNSRLPHLMAQLATATQTGGLPRDLLTRLTDEELTLASAAASLDAGYPGGFAKFSSLALDRLIGAPITQAIIEGAAFTVPAPQGRAYDVKNEPARVPPPAEPVEDAPRINFAKYLGLWELKANPNQVVDVVEVEERPGSTPLLHLKNADTLTVTDITLKYRRPVYAAD